MADFLNVDAHLCGDLFGKRIAAQLLNELAAHLRIFRNRFHHVHRNAHRAGLVGERAGDRLTDPPRGVRRKFETAAIIELFDCARQADIPFLDKIKNLKMRRAIDVALRDGNHKTQIRLHQALARLFVAFLRALRKFALFVF